MKSILPALIAGLFLALLVFAARCSQRAMHDYEQRHASDQSVEATRAEDDPNSSPSDLAENDRMAARFPDTLLATTGMRFHIERAGSGPRPIAGQRVRFHFTARLLDGTEIASAAPPADPAEIVVLKNETARGLPGPLRGLDLSLMEMQPDERRLVVVPSRLAFGAAGHPPLVPPRAAIVLEVELLDESRTEQGS